MVLLQAHQESLFQLATERLPDTTQVSRFEASSIHPEIERPAILNRSMPRIPAAVIALTFKSHKKSICDQWQPSNKEVNLHSINGSVADVERNVKMEGVLHSKIPSIFDHTVRNPSTIEPYYHLASDPRRARTASRGLLSAGLHQSGATDPSNAGRCDRRR